MQSPQALRAVRTLGAALFVVLISWPVPAQAHTTLVGSSPAAGVEVSPATGHVVLMFDAPLSAVGNDIVVRGPAGDEVTSAKTQVAGKTMQTQVDLVSPGQHTVAYRFVSVDGHADTGTLWFTVAAETAPPSAATVLAAPGPQPSVTSGAGNGEARRPWGDSAAVWLLPLAVGGMLVLAHHASTSRQRVTSESEDGPRSWVRSRS